MSLGIGSWAGMQTKSRIYGRMHTGEDFIEEDQF